MTDFHIHDSNADAQHVSGPLSDLFRMLREYPLRWTVPAVVCTLLAVFVAMRRTDTWQASQAMMVRNQGSTNSPHQRPGEFDRSEEMKTVQETILELSRSRTVLTNALKQVGPPTADDAEGVVAADAWPSDKAIEGLRGSIAVAPPKGAEFGTTEVFYLQVKDTDPQRARTLTTALCDQIKLQFQRLRDEKAQSMIDEIGQTVAAAQSDLDKSAKRLHEIEAAVGSDLGELRVLHKSPSGNSDLRRRVSSLDTELRAARATKRGHEELKHLLVQARGDLQSLVATPNSLLDSQPALRRLKDGLIDAQINTANVRSERTDEHPAVMASVLAEQEIRRRLTAELDIAVRGVDSDMRLANAEIAVLEGQLAQTNSRLVRLANVRADYAKTIEEVGTHRKLLEVAQENLADARSSQAAARSASLITLLDTPDVGSKPVSLSKNIIMAGGFVGGVAAGLGLLLLTVPTAPAPTPVAMPEWQQVAMLPAAMRQDGAELLGPRGGLSLRQAINKITLQATYH